MIKLDAIDSTNDYLKQISRENGLADFTLVFAENQLNGRGQMGAEWVSEPGKNLTISVLAKSVISAPEDIYVLNAAVSTAVLDTLAGLDVPDLSVKWPNDIMSGSKKIGGILIENVFKQGGNIDSVIGIGINVNQECFDNLPNASSIILKTARFIDREKLAIAIAGRIQQVLPMLGRDRAEIWDKFKKKLFRSGIPTAFEDGSGQFMAIITDVTSNGQLQLIDEHDRVRTYGIKDVKMLY